MCQQNWLLRAPVLLFSCAIWDPAWKAKLKVRHLSFLEKNISGYQIWISLSNLSLSYDKPISINLPKSCASVRLVKHNSFLSSNYVKTFGFCPKDLTRNSNLAFAPTFSTSVQESEFNRWNMKLNSVHFDKLNMVTLRAPIPSKTNKSQMWAKRGKDRMRWQSHRRNLSQNPHILSLFNWKYFSNFPFVAEIVA